MANWCDNTLRVSGTMEMVTKIRDEFKGPNNEPLLFNNHYPLEEGEPATTHWGTRTELDKCTDYEENLYNVEESSISYSFSTAWSPPCGWLERVVNLFPELNFEMTYQEPGVGLWGTASGYDGVFSDSTLTKDEFLMEVDDIYRDYVNDVSQFTQEELIKFFSGINSFEDCCIGNEEWPSDLIESYDWGNMDDYDVLALYIIPRIEFDNLPLFLNVNWGCYNYMFKDRFMEAQND